MGQRVIAPNYAVKKGIKLSFYGENVGEYGNKIEDNYRPTMRQIGLLILTLIMKR